VHEEKNTSQQKQRKNIEEMKNASTEELARMHQNNIQVAYFRCIVDYCPRMPIKRISFD
jgi:hypothetical protein